MEAVRATLAATVGTAPLLLAFGATLPVHGLAANLLAAPLGEFVALPASLLFVLASPWPWAEYALARVATGALRSVRAVAFAASTGPFATLTIPPPSDLQLALLAITACMLVARITPRRWVLVGALLALGAAEVHARGDGAPVGSLRITALDVGQGDSLLVDLPDGRAMLVDGGGMVGSGIDLGRRVLLPVLAARRRQRLDVVVITHPHPDHYLGLLTSLPSLQVGELWESGLA
jgi:competence protein ComEC